MSGFDIEWQTFFGEHVYVYVTCKQKKMSEPSSITQQRDLQQTTGQRDWLDVAVSRQLQAIISSCFDGIDSGAYLNKYFLRDDRFMRRLRLFYSGATGGLLSADIRPAPVGKQRGAGQISGVDGGIGRISAGLSPWQPYAAVLAAAGNRLQTTASAANRLFRRHHAQPGNVSGNGQGRRHHLSASQQSHTARCSQAVAAFATG